MTTATPRPPNRAGPRSEAMSNIARRVNSAGQSSSSTSNQSQPSSPRPQGGQILKAPANLLRRPANLRLQRSPSQQARPSGRRPGQSVSLDKYAASAIQANRSGQGPEARRRRASRATRNIDEDADDDADSKGGGTEADFMELINESAPKLENKPYTPIPVTLEDLRKAWPSIPTGQTAQLESIEERLRWLAKRTPVGFTPHHELALRLIKGDLVAFESEDEKVAVFELVKKMQSRAAEEETEEKGEIIEPKDVGYQSLPSEQAKQLTDHFIRGTYAELTPQRFPLLDQVVRQLRNNETFQDEKSQRFLSKIGSLIPQQQAQQQQAAGGGNRGQKQPKKAKATT